MTKLLMPTFNFFDFSRRDIGCLTAATLIHCLLFLWTGIPLEFLDRDKKKLGETIVQVQFRSDVPTSPYSTSAGKQSKGFFSKVKSFFKAPAEKDPGLLAKGQQQKITTNKTLWKKADTKLTNKNFTQQSEFNGLNKTTEDTLAQGLNQKMSVDKFKGNSLKADPTLKQKDYRIAKKDSPFKIVKPKNNDALAMANTVPVNVGRKTSKSIKSLGAQSNSPTLSSKSFGSRGKDKSGFGSLATGSSSKIGGAQLATGQTGGTIGGTGALASSKSYGNKGNGFSKASFGESKTLASISGGVSGGTSSLGKGGGPGISISGELANRKILRRAALPTPDDDARVRLKFRVDWMGRVLDGIVVLISSGSPSFDRRVISALKNWVFSRLSPDRSNEIQEGIIDIVFRGI